MDRVELPLKAKKMREISMASESLSFKAGSTKAGEPQETYSRGPGTTASRPLPKGLMTCNPNPHQHHQGVWAEGSSLLIFITLLTFTYYFQDPDASRGFASLTQKRGLESKKDQLYKSHPSINQNEEYRSTSQHNSKRTLRVSDWCS